jgi:hypothetical protein
LLDWQRYTRIAGSFLITAACYTAYAAAIAPLLEPPEPKLIKSGINDGDKRQLVEAARHRRDYLAQWFGPNDWELTAPMTLETPQGTLLFDEYRQTEGGMLEIHPCTMIIISNDTQQAALDPEKARRAVVLRAPQGALLRFDSPIDLSKAAIGKLIGGELIGDVDIHSDQRLAGPDDDLHVKTRNIALNQAEITTPEWMEFRLGPHFGRGRGLQIVLAPAGADDSGLAARGVREFNLLEQVFVHIEPSSQGDLFPGKNETAAVAPGAGSPPVEVRSSGRFTFDLAENFALFRKQVDVVRLNADGKIDQMNGDQLKIVFDAVDAPTPIPVEGAAPVDKKKAKKLEPRRIEFTGEPVVIRAPGNDMQARAQYVEHDLTTRSVRLRDAIEVIVRQQDREIRAPEIFFIPDPYGNYGTFQAAGRGSLEGSSPSDPRQTFQAQWTTRLHFRRHEDRQVLSLHGEARFAASGKGGLSGDEIHLWLMETPKAAAAQTPGQKPQTELAPDRLLVLNQVQIESPQMVGSVQRLEGWFEQETPRAVAHRVNYQQVDGELAPQPFTPAATFPTVPAPVMSAPAPFVPAPATEFAPLPPPPERQFRIDGDVLRLRIAVVAQQMELREAVVERNVKVTETKTKSPQEKPLILQGDRLHVVQPTPTESHVTVTGSPAYVEAQQLTVSGGKLVLDRPDEFTNRVGVAGQGVLTMPVDRDLQGRATATPETLHLSWQGGMSHDGKIAVFERGVEARLSTQNLKTDRLQVVFAEKQTGGMQVPNSSTQPEIARVECFDGVQIESRTTAPDGNPIALDRVQARTLMLDQKTGDFVAEGPGEVTSLRLGAAGNMPGMTPPQPGQQFVPQQPVVANPNSPAGTKINYLQVRFQRQLVGNHPRREMTFLNQVRTLYGPVPDWTSTIDPDRTDRWSQETVRVDCEKMQVFSRSDVASNTETVDLIAEGNALVEGTTFTARAPRLTYAQSKDLLVIEGDGRTDAQLFHHKPRNGSPLSTTSAKRFMFWPSTNRAQIDGASSAELKPN